MEEIVTVNTHKGLVQFNHLAFGVTSAPAILQKYMDMILHGIPKIQCVQDDIIIARVDEKEHSGMLEQVLQ